MGRKMKTWEKSVGAPQLREDWQQRLALLGPGWDADGGKAITSKAIETLGRFAAVPCSDGGIQLEVHRAGYDIEIEIGPDGRIASVLVDSDPEHEAATK